MMSKIRFVETVLKTTVFVALATCAVVGCRKEEPSKAPPSAVSEDIKHDKAFRAQLETQRKATNKSIQSRNEIGRQMAEMTEKVRAKLKTTDENLVNAELEKSPAWRSLKAQLTRAEQEFAENRQKMLALTRERLTRGAATKPVSK